MNGSKNANTWSVFRKLRQDVEVSERRRPGRSEHDVRDWKASPAPAIKKNHFSNEVIFFCTNDVCN